MHDTHSHSSFRSLFSWMDAPHHQKILGLLRQGPGEGRFVGGAVRNTLLGKPVTDFDIATNHVPQVTQDILAQAGVPCITTGLAHGTVTALVQGIAYEITTLRQDVETHGRHAKVAYTQSWYQDAQRRDFTLNALYIDDQKVVYDYTGGLQDLAQGRIRFIGNARARIGEDYLRILRFFRMQASYGTTWNAEALDAIDTEKAGLDILSKERITMEILKLLQTKHPWQVLEVMGHHQLWPYILGHKEEQHVLPGLAQGEEHLGLQLPPLTRLAALYPWASWRQNHGRAPEKPPEDFFSPLALSRQQRRCLEQLMLPLAFSPPWLWQQALYKLPLEVVQGRLILTLCRDKPFPLAPQDLELLEKAWKAVEDFCPPPVFPLTGNHVQALGLKGPAVGAMLDKLHGWWLQEKCHPNWEDCLAEGRRHITETPEEHRTS